MYLVCIVFLPIFHFCHRFLLQVGTLIYVRVVKANPGMNPELSCTDGWFSSVICFCWCVPENIMVLTSTSFSRFLADLFIYFSCFGDLLISLSCILQPAGKQQNLANLRMVICLNLRLVYQERENHAPYSTHFWCLIDLSNANGFHVWTHVHYA